MNKILALDFQQQDKNDMVVNGFYDLKKLQEEIKTLQAKEKQIKDFLKSKEFKQISIIRDGYIDILKITQYESSKVSVDSDMILEEILLNFQNDPITQRKIAHIFEKHTSTKKVKNIKFTFSKDE